MSWAGVREVLRPKLDAASAFRPGGVGARAALCFEALRQVSCVPQGVHRSLAARPSVVQALKAAGVRVFTWTLDTPEQWKRATEVGVDGIITNRPEAFIGWKQAR